MTLLGYCLMGKKWYDTLAGTLKAIIGMLILNAGSGGLTSTFRPILAGLKDRFKSLSCITVLIRSDSGIWCGSDCRMGWPC